MLEEDAQAIFDNFGQNFITPRNSYKLELFRYSTGHSSGIGFSNLPTLLGFYGAGNGIRKFVSNLNKTNIYNTYQLVSSSYHR